ncbi:sugar phosphate isomerase/epimerase family protein [candidate division KSB1 bacterium]
MIYISSCCLEKIRDLRKVLEQYWKEGIRNVELSGCHPHMPDVKEIVDSYKFNYLVHNYFPPPKEAFVFNLASNDKSVLKRSLELAKQAVKLCNKMGAPIYSVHTGYRQDPGLGFKFDVKGPAILYNDAINIFKKSLKEIADFAHDHSVKIGFENQPAKNPHGDVKEFITFIKAEEFNSIVKEIGPEKIGVVLDIAHLENAATIMKFDIDSFIEDVRENVIELHVCDNDENSVHTHVPLKESSKSVAVARSFKNMPITIESVSDIKGILKAKQLLENL